jgi:NitT/TauT family transport system substrate-binding protein
MNSSRVLRNLYLTAAFSMAWVASATAQTTLTVGIGTQDTTTNTATAGVVIRELKLMEKYLPKTGKYAGMQIKLDWQNFTSGPPVTNGMMANKLHIGAMGDYPLVVNGFTFQSNPESKSQLIAVAAYNIHGSGNGVVVHKDSNYFELKDLKGKVLSVPFGSAAHGMVLKAMQDQGWPQDYFRLVSQSPEVGTTNLQEKKIDSHADFVPFAELLPFRGFARKIFDGVETNAPTWHGVVARTDFAEKYPEIVVAYLKALVEANAWVKANPKLAAEKIAQWTGIEKEVVYIFLGPSGIMTMDPTIKPELVKDAAEDAKVLQNMGRMKDFDVEAWANDKYLRQAYAELKLDYDSQKSDYSNYEISGEDTFCKTPIVNPRKAAEIWTEDGIKIFASATCMFGGMAEQQKKGKKAAVAYLFDDTRGIKLFADQAFYVLASQGGKVEVVPFLLKKDAEAYAAKTNGKVLMYADAMKAVAAGG